jgi:hypothetical protein
LKVADPVVTAGPHRWLLPREHGAYAELLFPVVTGWASRSPDVATVLFTVAVVAGFLSYEPLMVLRGVRGRRLQDALGETAHTQLLLFLSVGTVTGVLAVALTGTATQVAALVPAACAVALLPWLYRHRLKTLAAEILVVAAFSATVLPLAVREAADWRFAWTAAAVWCGSFTLGTLAVHAIKVRHKQTVGVRWSRPAAPALALVAVGIGVVGPVLGAIPVTTGVALVVPAVLAGLFSVLPVHPRRLKRVGWSLVVANVITLVLLLLR